MRPAPRVSLSPGQAHTSPVTSRTWSDGWRLPWTRRHCAELVRARLGQHRTHHRAGGGHRVLDPDRLDKLFVVGVDEVSWRKGHSYITLISNQYTTPPASSSGARRARTPTRWTASSTSWARERSEADHGHVDGHGARLMPEFRPARRAMPPRPSSVMTHFTWSSSAPRRSTSADERCGRRCARSTTNRWPNGSRGRGGPCSRTPVT